MSISNGTVALALPAAPWWVAVAIPVATGLVLFGLWVVALDDVLRRPDFDFPPMANGADPKRVWTILVVLFNIVGAAVYYVLVMRPYPRR